MALDDDNDDALAIDSSKVLNRPDIYGLMQDDGNFIAKVWLLSKYLHNFR